MGTDLGLCTRHAAVTDAATGCAKVGMTCCAPDFTMGALLHN